MFQSIAESLREKISRPPSMSPSSEGENIAVDGFSLSDDKPNLFVTVPLSGLYEYYDANRKYFHLNFVYKYVCLQMVITLDL